jgi:hypothetical protein
VREHSGGPPPLMPSLIVGVGLGGPLGWDLGFLAFGALMVAVGWTLTKGFVRRDL